MQKFIRSSNLGRDFARTLPAERAAFRTAQRAFACSVGTSSGSNDTAEEEDIPERKRPRRKLPPWFRMQNPNRSEEAKHAFTETKATLKDLGLATVCVEAKCPNLSECWGEGTATVMILGDKCTRACRFCSVKTAKNPGDVTEGSELWNEPEKVANAISKWDHLKYVVITCVDRDDLMDFGACHIAKTVKLVKQIGLEEKSKEAIEKDAIAFGVSPNNTPEQRHEVLVETLLGDFRGDLKLVDIAVSAGMDVFAHNVETVERLNSFVRDRRAGYKQSLSVLEHVNDRNAKGLNKDIRTGETKNIITKTSIMVGMGETDEEILQTMKDLRNIGVRAVTLGQYLQPTKGHMQVHRYPEPAKFAEYEEWAKELGFDMVASGPLVRSSYRAGELYLTRLIEKDRQILEGARQAYAKRVAASV